MSPLHEVELSSLTTSGMAPRRHRQNLGRAEFRTPFFSVPRRAQNSARISLQQSVDKVDDAGS